MVKFIHITKHPVPTGNPPCDMVCTPEVYAKEAKKAQAVRKKALADLRGRGIEVINVKDGRYVHESWYETEKEVPVQEGA